MPVHLSAEELDFVNGQIGKTPIEVHKALGTKRARKGVPAPNLTNVRKVLKGLTYKRGGVETRGRKLKLSKANVRKMNSVRRVLQNNADGEREVTWGKIRKAARAPKVCATTSLRAFRREGIAVQARRPREKPQRTKEHADERVRLCEGLQSKPAKWFSEKGDLMFRQSLVYRPRRGGFQLLQKRVRAWVPTSNRCVFARIVANLVAN
jgi:hypothetical protein